MSEIISIREYGRRKSWSDTYVRRLIANGIISAKAVTTNPNNGRPQIIFEKAEEDLRMNYSAPRKEAREAAAAGLPKPHVPYVATPPTSIKIEGVEEDHSRKLPGGTRPKSEIDRLRAEIQLQQAAIELRKTKGELVEKSKVYSALYEIGQFTKSNVLGVVDKVIDEVLAAPNRGDARAILYSRLNDALTSVSNVSDGDLNLNDRGR